MVKTITFKQQKFSQSNPFLTVSDNFKKSQFDPALIWLKLASILIRAQHCLSLQRGRDGCIGWTVIL